jgi:hypothetical protein
VTESTGLKPVTFPYTGYLIFDRNLPMPKEHVCRFTHAHALATDGDLNLSLKYIISCIDLSRITSLTQGGPKTEQSGNEFIGIHSLPHLRSLCLNISTLIFLLDRHWPQIIDLNMKNDSPHPYQCLSSTEIDAFCHSFTHLKQFAFDRQSVRQLSRFFNNITMTLSNISIRHHGKLSSYNPRVITREWLEQHTKQNDFDYFNDSEWDV